MKPERNPELIEKTEKAFTILTQLELTLAHLVENVLKSSVPTNIPLDSWTINKWWVHYVPYEIREPCEKRKSSAEIRGTSKEHAWEYASLGDLRIIIKKNIRIFALKLFYGNRPGIHVILSYLSNLISYRHRFAHPRPYISSGEIKDFLNLTSKLLILIPPVYHVESIQTDLRRIIHEEETAATRQLEAEEREEKERIKIALRYELDVNIAFKAGEKDDDYIFSLLTGSAHDEMVNCLTQAFIASQLKLDRINNAWLYYNFEAGEEIDMSFEMDIAHAYTDVVLDLLLDNIEDAEEKHRIAKEKLGTEYESHLVSVVEILREESRSDPLGGWTYDNFLNSVNEHK